MPVTEGELRAQADQIRITQSTLPLARQPRKRTLSLRLNALHLQAAPGPSGARNGLIRATADVRGGFEALAAYVTMWKSSRVTRFTAHLWTSAIVTPIDCNAKSCLEYALCMGYEAPLLTWKLRPIARAECLLKFAEGVILKEDEHLTSKFLLPHQLGCGVSAACQLAVTIVQSLSLIHI